MKAKKLNLVTIGFTIELLFYLFLIIFIIWSIIHPKPYMFGVLVNMVIPIVGIFIYIIFKNNHKVNFVFIYNPFGPMTLAISSMCLSFLSFRDLNVFYNFKLWMYITVTTLIIFALMLKNIKKFRLNNKGEAIFLAIVIFLYTYGVILFLNCLLDKSAPIVYTVNIKKEYITTSSKGGTNYHIVLDSWGPVTTTNDIRVSKELYKNIVRDHQLYVHLKKGAFGIQWFIPSNSKISAPDF